MSSPKVQLPPVERRHLANGLTLLVVERRSLPLVTLRLRMPAGAAYEGEAPVGISSFTARMLGRGAAAHDATAFAEELDFLGGILDASAGFDHFGLDAEFTSETLDAGLELFLAALRSPRLEQAEFEKERERAVAEVVQARDDADTLADEAFLHYLYRGHAYGRGAAGSQRELLALSRQDVVNYHAERLRPDGAVLVVVGDVNGEAFATRLEAALSDWKGRGHTVPPPPAAEKCVGSPVILVDDPGSTQVQYRTGQIGVARTTPRWYPLITANCVLGGGFTSRLVEEVRVKRGLSYGVSSNFTACRTPGPFAVSSFTQEKSLQELHEVTASVMADFRSAGPTNKELDLAKNFLAGLSPRRVETPGGLAAALAEVELFGLELEAITEFRRDVAAVTLEEAAEAAREELPDENRLTVLVGPADQISSVAESMGELSIVPSDYAETAE